MIDWWCPKCTIRIEFGEAAWLGWYGVEPICYDCGTDLEVRDLDKPFEVELKKGERFPDAR